MTDLLNQGTSRQIPRAWLTHILEHSRDGILLVDEQGAVRLVNESAATLLGSTTDALEGSSFGIPVGSKEPTLMHVLGEPGGIRHVEILSTPIEEGPRGDQLVILRDVTANHRLENLNEDLELFKRAVSHDLREPVRMMERFLGRLEERGGEALEGDLGEYLDFARDGAHRLSAMLDGLLSYARLGSGEQTAEEVSVEAALSDALGNLALTIEETGAEITHGELPTVVSNHGQLVLVFQNLIANAIRYTPEDRTPQISIEATQAGRQCTIAVEDNAEGIPPEQQDLVFDLFHQVDPYGGDGVGSGMGLAICKRIIQHHGGEIWVESDPPHGSTFSFTLQAGRVASATEQAESSSTA